MLSGPEVARVQLTRTADDARTIAGSAAVTAALAPRPARADDCICPTEEDLTDERIGDDALGKYRV
jgi:hypothetical protein